MTNLAQLELFYWEARDIVSRAETDMLRLERDGAREGHLLMAAQILAAVRHLSRIIEHHCHHPERATLPLPATAGRPAARKRVWWIVPLRPGRGYSGNWTSRPSNLPVGGQTGGAETTLRSGR